MIFKRNCYFDKIASKSPLRPPWVPSQSPKILIPKWYNIELTMMFHFVLTMGPIEPFALKKNTAELENYYITYISKIKVLHTSQRWRAKDKIKTLNNLTCAVCHRTSWSFFEIKNEKSLIFFDAFFHINSPTNSTAFFLYPYTCR